MELESLRQSTNRHAAWVSNAQRAMKVYFNKVNEVLEEFNISRVPRPVDETLETWSQSFIHASDSLLMIPERANARLLEDGREIAHNSAAYVLACYRSRDSSFDPSVPLQGIVTDQAEAAMEAVQDAARFVAGKVSMTASSVSPVDPKKLRDPLLDPASSTSEEDDAEAIPSDTKS